MHCFDKFSQQECIEVLEILETSAGLTFFDKFTEKFLQGPIKTSQDLLEIGSFLVVLQKFDPNQEISETRHFRSVMLDFLRSSLLANLLTCADDHVLLDRTYQLIFKLSDLED
jgi:hypothetical protein